LNGISDTDTTKHRLRVDLPRLMRRTAVLNRAIFWAVVSSITLNVFRAPASRQVRTLPRISSKAKLKSTLIDADIKLRNARQDGGVTTTVSLARYGAFEVRLIQPLRIPPAGEARFWIELFDHDRQLSIDSVGNCLLENAVAAAGELIARAKDLSENPHSWRRPSENPH
jgi:hypothetical protein